MSKTVLITGASGFFGKSLRRALEKRHTAAHYICVSRQAVRDEHDKRFSWVRANLLNPEERVALIQKYQPTYLIHLAWFVEPKNFWHASQNVAWIHATCALFESFVRQGGKHFIGAGSLAEYDLSAKPLDENAPIKPVTLYGESKATTYRLLCLLKESLKAQVVLQWLRIGYFFGEDEPAEKFFSTVVRKMLRNENLDLIPEDCIRDYGHVDHLGTLLTSLLETHQDIVLNASGGSHETIGAIIDFLTSRLGYKKKANYGAYPLPHYEPEVLIPQSLHTRFQASITSDSLFRSIERFIKHKVGAHEYR